MSHLWLGLFLSVVHWCSSVYVPGTPGADWSAEEVRIVKGKLYRFFSRFGASYALRKVSEPLNQFPSGMTLGDTPRAQKLLRLAFHDCLKYTDGTGGCDGCLNWDGVGTRFSTEDPMHGSFENVVRTNNNGLDGTVQVMELLYTRTNFPKKTPVLPMSLYDSGKSRADLWAFAAIVAVEFSLQANNEVCAGQEQNRRGLKLGFWYGRQCNALAGQTGCAINEPRPIQFQTGRKDCVPQHDLPYKASKTESHPKATGNGEDTVGFFKHDFDFTGRETAAIMGAHSIGRFIYAHSLFRYMWTMGNEGLLNNDYYKNIVLEPRWFPGPHCGKVGDAFGNIPRTRWTTHVRGDTVNGGPVHWIHVNYACPACEHKNEVDNSCCLNLDAGESCQPDNGRTVLGIDQDEWTGCERYKFISGLDEMAMNCEMGLYYDFNVTDDGIPYGCPGLERFNTANWNMPWSSSTGDWMHSQFWGHPECPKQTLAEPPGSEPLSQIMEQFASDQDRWYSDFIGALEKMMSNGYGADELRDGPSLAGLHCEIPDKLKNWNGECVYNYD